MTEKIRIGIVDDHVMLRQSYSTLLTDYGFDVIVDGSNGKNFTEKLNLAVLPDVVLTDINMPGMDGFETAKWMTENYPSVKILALTMLDDDATIIKMLRCGARGYILKDTQPEDVVQAINCVAANGFYHVELIDAAMYGHLKPADKHAMLTKKEWQFLELSCSEMSYADIAAHMKQSPRTINGYKESIFHKLQVKSRIGLVIYARKNNLCSF